MANLSSYLPDGIDESNVAITGGSINGTTVGASTAAAGTFTTFTSNGIDDNADAVAITIDSSENVGIGTASPSKTLELGALDVQRWQTGSVTLDLTPTAGATDSFVFNTSQNAIYDFSMNGTVRMRLDSSGNVTVGTTNAVTDSLSIAPSYNLSWADSANSAYANVFRQKSSAATVLASGYKYSETSNKMDSAVAASWGKSAVWTGYETIKFYVDAASADAVGTDLTPTERMQIDSTGGVRIGLTSNIFNSANHERMSVKHAGLGNAATFEATNVTGGFPVVYVRSTDSTSGSQNAILFHRGSTQVGSITTTGSSTAFNTSSDYRLKENVTPLTEAIDRVRQIPVHRFNFIEDPNVTVDGFLAHEVQGHVPEAVTGEKDGMRTEEYEITPAVLDDMGNTLEDSVMGTREVPDYQGIDQSKLVPLLTAALQEAVTRIETLEAEVAELKAT